MKELLEKKTNELKIPNCDLVSENTKKFQKEEKTCVNTNQENSQESLEIKQKPVRILRKFK